MKKYEPDEPGIVAMVFLWLGIGLVAILSALATWGWIFSGDVDLPN